MAVNVIDTGNARQHQIENEEVALEAVGNVVLATSGMLHGGKVLQILARFKVSALVLVQKAKATVLHGQADQLQRGLVAPLVHFGHRYVIKEYRHLLAVGRAKILTTSLVQLGFDGILRHARSSGR